MGIKKVPVEMEVVGGGSMGGSMSGSGVPSGKAQKEVLAMLLGDEPITIPQIAYSRQTTVRAVYNIIQKLREQGFLQGSSFNGWEQGAGYMSTGVQSVSNSDLHFLCRLHAQRFIAKIIDFSNGYTKQKYLQKIGNKGIDFQGNTIKLRSNCIEVYSNTSFKDTSVESCDQQALSYWANWFVALQGKLGLLLLKPGRYPIRETYNHLALMNNGFAYDQNRRQERIMFFDQETGKLWLQTDRSFRIPELECEGNTAREDCTLLQKHFEDMRNPTTPLLSEMHKLVAEIVHLEVLRTQNQQPLYSPEHIADVKHQHRELPSYFG